MSVNPLSASIANKMLQGLTSTTTLTKSNSATSTTATQSVDSPTGMSKMGELMKKLDGLATSDPDKFKEVTSNIASQLKDLASTLSGDEADHVSDLASKFEGAAKSGTMNSLKPSGPPPPQGGAPPKGAAAYARNQSETSNASTDIRSRIDSIVTSALG